ncbi:MAG: DUF6600 domain-containing protein [Chitinophagales bacterium]
MKRVYKLKSILLTVTFGAVLFTACDSTNTSIQSSPAASTTASITYQDFYDGLSSYGLWINYPVYGNVWRPQLEAGFRPYDTDGHWAYTNYGWTWVSDYSWGWAPFHYGRWLYDDIYGWLWIPGYEWSPAWVTWGYTGNYYCWAPLMPGISLGVNYSEWTPHSIYWNAVDKAHIYDRNIGTITAPREVINNIQNNITVINNYNKTDIHKQIYSKGPNIEEVEKYTNKTIAPITIHEVNTVKEIGEVNKVNNNVVNNKTVNTISTNKMPNSNPINDVEVNKNQNQINVYKPIVLHPQPREFRVFENNTPTHPVISNEEKPIGPRTEQWDNTYRLPTHTSPYFSNPTFHLTAPRVPEGNFRKH